MSPIDICTLAASLIALCMSLVSLMHSRRCREHVGDVFRAHTAYVASLDNANTAHHKALTLHSHALDAILHIGERK